MRTAFIAVTTILLITILPVGFPVRVAESKELTDEPDKTMAAAHESFVKGETKKAAEYLQTSATYVRGQADKVAKSASAGVKKAGDQLDQLGKAVSDGTVKSADEMKKTFASVDHALAKAWHTTAAQANKAGKDSTEMLKNAGSALDGAAEWSGARLKEGSTTAVEGAKKIGTGAKAGANEVVKIFKGLGEGIADVGRQLKGQ